MRTHRFGRKIKLPATIAIKRQIIMLIRKQRPNLSNSQRGELFARHLTRRVARYPNMDSFDVYEPNPGSPEAVCQNSRWQRAASQHPQEPLRVWAWGR
jgi:hypothetical protein